MTLPSSHFFRTHDARAEEFILHLYFPDNHVVTPNAIQVALIASAIDSLAGEKSLTHGNWAQILLAPSFFKLGLQPFFLLNILSNVILQSKFFVNNLLELCLQRSFCLLQLLDIKLLVFLERAVVVHIEHSLIPLMFNFRYEFLFLFLLNLQFNYKTGELHAIRVVLECF